MKRANYAKTTHLNDPTICLLSGTVHLSGQYVLEYHGLKHGWVIFDADDNPVVDLGNDTAIWINVDNDIVEQRAYPETQLIFEAPDYPTARDGALDRAKQIADLAQQIADLAQ